MYISCSLHQNTHVTASYQDSTQNSPWSERTQSGQWVQRDVGRCIGAKERIYKDKQTDYIVAGKFARCTKSCTSLALKIHSAEIQSGIFHQLNLFCLTFNVSFFKECFLKGVAEIVHVLGI